MRRVSGSGAWRSRKLSSETKVPSPITDSRNEAMAKSGSSSSVCSDARPPTVDSARRSAGQRGAPGEDVDVAGLVGDRDGEELLDLAEVRVDLAEEAGRDDERGLLVLDQERHHLHDGGLDLRAVVRSAPSSRSPSPGPTARPRPGRRGRPPGRSRSRRGRRGANARRRPAGLDRPRRGRRAPSRRGGWSTTAPVAAGSARRHAPRRPTRRPTRRRARRRRPRRAAVVGAGRSTAVALLRHHARRWSGELGVRAAHHDGLAGRGAGRAPA